MDQNSQPNSTPPASYVDDYAPPALTPQHVQQPPATQMTAPMPGSGRQASPFQAPGQPPAQPQPPVYHPQAGIDLDSGIVDDMSSQVPPRPLAVDQTSAPPAADSEELEDQNIFEMLGINGISDTEKESFLDELQQVIWEDFAENDTKLLLTQEEYAQFSALAGKSYPSEDEKQGALIDFVDKIIPDLEKIMLEKALELKEEMFRERIKDMQQSPVAGAQDKAKQAEAAINQGLWAKATKALS